MTSRYFAKSLLLALMAVLAFVAPAQAEDTGLEAALVESRETGMPLLVLGTATWCGPCQRLKHQLSSDEALEPLLRQYVSVALDVESPEFAQWKALHQPHSDMIPMLFIVTSEGEELYNASGVPRVAELTRILNLGIDHRQQAEHIAQLPAENDAPAAEEAVVESNENVDELPMEVREARAESYLRMAQVLAEGRPQRSRQLAEQTVELAPESRQAELARKLLSTLPEYR